MLKVSDRSLSVVTTSFPSLRDMSLFAIKPLFVKKGLIIFQKFLLPEKSFPLDQCLVGFFIFAEISEMLKKTQLEKLVSPVKWSAWLYASTLQNFARWHFFDVNRVSIVISWEGDVEMGENKWKILNRKLECKVV